MATFTGKADGTAPITYQWQQDTAGDGIFADMPGETGESITVPDESLNQYRFIATNACGEVTSDAASIPQTTDCDAVETLFATLNGYWFVSRGYKSDATGIVGAGEYTGGVSNIAFNTPYPANGDTVRISKTTAALADFVNCEDEDIWFWNGNNTGNGSSMRHLRSATNAPNYAGGQIDNYIQGGFFRTGLSKEVANAGRALGKTTLKTFLFADSGMYWNPVTGRVNFAAGWATSDPDEKLYLDCGGEDPSFTGYDVDDNAIWRMLAWRLVKTNSDVTITIWKDGVQSGTYNQTLTEAGTPLSSASWWVTDDGDASRDPRGFVWGYAQNRYDPWWITFPFVGDPAVIDTSKFADLRAAFDTQQGN